MCFKTCPSIYCTTNITFTFYPFLCTISEGMNVKEYGGVFSNMIHYFKGTQVDEEEKSLKS